MARLASNKGLSFGSPLPAWHMGCISQRRVELITGAFALSFPGSSTLFYLLGRVDIYHLLHTAPKHHHYLPLVWHQLSSSTHPV